MDAHGLLACAKARLVARRTSPAVPVPGTWAAPLPPTAAAAQVVNTASTLTPIGRDTVGAGVLLPVPLGKPALRLTAAAHVPRFSSTRLVLLPRDPPAAKAVFVGPKRRVRRLRTSSSSFSSPPLVPSRRL